MPFNRPIPESKRPEKASNGMGALIEAEKLVQIAFVLPAAVLIGWLGGTWLDGRLHQSWIALAGFILGSISGMVSAIRMAMSHGAAPKTKDKNGSGTGNAGSGGEQ
jgi:F0F1-type ATP synthase assembly protein I